MEIRFATIDKTGRRHSNGICLIFMETIMKTCYTLFILGLTLLLVASCNKKEDISITYFKQQQSMPYNTDKEDSMIYCGLIEYDSVRFSDGSYAVHRLQYAPQNSLTEFFDCKGRTIATIARASECYAQTLVYDYDNEGRLAHLLRYEYEIFEGLESDSTGYGRTKEGYLGFRQMIANIDYEHPDTTKYEQTNIEYDKDGDVVKAYIVYGKDSIVAPIGYKLSVSVEPCRYFWQSDLNGGFYIFHAVMTPKRNNLPEYKVCRFADYMPSVESDYRNGYIVKTVWHRDPCIEPDDKDLVFTPVRTGDLNVYSITRKDGSKHQRAYKNGLLAYKQEISRYGTVLKKETYSFLSNNKAKVTFESIDYKTKTLKTQSVSMTDITNMEMYHEDMNVVSENYRWENYYNK